MSMGYSENPGCFNAFKKLHIAHCGKEEKRMAAAVGWPILWAVQLAIDAQLEAKAQVKKFEEGLRLKKSMQISTMLALGLADKTGEQDNKLENSVTFAKKSHKYHGLRSQHCDKP